MCAHSSTNTKKSSWASKNVDAHQIDQIWIPNIIRFSEITNYQIPNTIRYWQNQNTKYQILFGIKKIQILNSNSTIRSSYSNIKFNFFCTLFLLFMIIHHLVFNIQFLTIPRGQVFPIRAYEPNRAVWLVLWDWGSILLLRFSWQER